jgi:hypothetical protein
LTAVILTGGALLPGISHALAHTTGQPPFIPARPDLAAADGVDTLTGRPIQHAEPPILPTIRPRAPTSSGWPCSYSPRWPCSRSPSLACGPARGGTVANVAAAASIANSRLITVGFVAAVI